MGFKRISRRDIGESKEYDCMGEKRDVTVDE